MPTHFSTRRIPITCANCRHEFEQPLAWLKEHPTFRCPLCDASIVADRDTLKGSSRQRAVPDSRRP